MINEIAASLFSPEGPTVNPQYQPSQRTWNGLTLADMEDLAVSKEWLAGARWAEAKLKEKNT